MDSLNVTTTIALRYPTSNWDLIWNNIIQFHNPKERLTLFKFMHKILPTGDYFNRLKILKNIPRCADCWLGQNSQKHIFESCIHHKDKRNKLINDLKNIEPKKSFRNIKRILFSSKFINFYKNSKFSLFFTIWVVSR